MVPPVYLDRNHLAESPVDHEFGYFYEEASGSVSASAEHAILMSTERICLALALRPWTNSFCLPEEAL